MDKGAPSVTHRVKMGCGNVYLRVVIDDNDKPKAVFITIGKAGGCQAALASSLASVITRALESDVSLKLIIKALRGVTCFESQPGEPETRCTSCVDALAKILEQYNNPFKGEKK